MKRIFYILFACVTFSLHAQDFQGKAIYQFNDSYTTVDWGAKNLSAAETAMWKSKLSKASRKTYELTFNLQESSWAKVEELAVGGGKGGDKASWGESKDKLLYKNLSEQIYALETEAFDKQFLVNGKLELPTWELTNETKQIGDYTAQKATYTIEEKRMAFGKNEMESTQREVEAWFTMEIPISNGPEYHWGLPGLILELKSGSTSYICERVELNTAGDFEIVIPKKGQKVTTQELEEIMEKKTDEMYKRFNKTGKKG